jgi:ribosomal protein L37AE/L43A
MTFDDIPEDRQESHECPTPGCEGSVVLNEDDQTWECDTCPWTSGQSEPFNPPLGA